MTSPVLSVSTSNGRFYQHPTIEDAFVPSITNITGMKDKPALKNWAAKQAAIFAVENIDTLTSLAKNDPKAAIDLVKGAPWRSSATAATRGDAVHDWVDEFIKARLRGDDEFTPEPGDFESAGSTARGMWKQFLAFDRKYQPKYLASEYTVWSEKHLYAGTGDFIAEIGKRISRVSSAAPLFASLPAA
jgi:hypothetical protein